MKTYDVPSLYRYCIVRLSTLATSTLTSALNVLSTVLPDSMFLSLERTTAPPLPGLWCWNQMTCQSWPSRLSTMPFLRSFVVAMGALQPSRWSWSGAVESSDAVAIPRFGGGSGGGSLAKPSQPGLDCRDGPDAGA